MQPAQADGLLRLSPQEQLAIGLVTQPVGKEFLDDSLPLTGWLVVPPAREAPIKSPFTGFYLPANDDFPIDFGSHIAADQQLGRVQALLSPQEEAQLVAAKEEADILMNQSLVSLRLAEKQLVALRDQPPGLVAGTRLIELEEITERARVAHKEAQEQLPFLPTEPYETPLDFKSAPIESPLAGRITAVHVVPRQLVVQGDVLWTVADWSTLWLRVPVFTGDLPTVRQDQPAQAHLPGSSVMISLRPASVALPTELGRRTIDLYYEIDNSAGGLRPGVPISVALPVGNATERLVISRSAVVWDGLGNAWVYVRTAPDAFRRQRVELGQGGEGSGVGRGEIVTIERGLQERQEVVTIGAESLYGEEFQEQIQVEDED